MRSAKRALAVVAGALTIAAAGLVLWIRPAPRVARTVADLPLVRLGSESPDAPLAVFFSGDGGWATLSRSVSSRLAAHGFEVVGWNSLRWFWRARTAAETARALEAVLREYGGPGERPVLLVGYSFGADALPFVVNRLSAPVRARVRGVALLGFAPRAAFEFHLPGWFDVQLGPTYPTAPEVRRAVASGIPVLCVNGTSEREQGCARVRGAGVVTRPLDADHDFDGRYDRLAALLLDFYAGEARLRR